MARTALMTRLLAMALAAFAVVGVVTPVCAMPDCGDVTTGTCSDFMPACDDCPDSIVMKHTHDDATTVQGHVFESPAALAYVVPVAPVVPQAPLPAQPEATSAPPPLDPLGVRLTI